MIVITEYLHSAWETLEIVQVEENEVKNYFIYNKNGYYKVYASFLDFCEFYFNRSKKNNIVAEFDSEEELEEFLQRGQK